MTPLIYTLGLFTDKLSLYSFIHQLIKTMLLFFGYKCILLFKAITHHLLLSFWYGMYLVYLFHKTWNCYKFVLNIKTYCESCLFWSSAVKTEIPWYLSNKNNENYILCYKTGQNNQETIYYTPTPHPPKNIQFIYIYQIFVIIDPYTWYFMLAQLK